MTIRDRTKPDKRAGKPAGHVYLSPHEKLELWRRYGPYLPAVHRQIMHLWLDERMYQPDIAVYLGHVKERPSSADGNGKWNTVQTFLTEGGLMLYGMKLIDDARREQYGGSPAVVDAD